MKVDLKSGKKENKNKEAFSVCHDCLIYTKQIVIPESLLKLVLKQFRAGHSGVSRIKALKQHILAKDVSGD